MAPLDPVQLKRKQAERERGAEQADGEEKVPDVA
jgi:hypothetical protein